MARRGGGRSRWGDNGFESFGGYFAAKKAKLEDQFADVAALEAGGERKGIFQGIAIFVDGYTGVSNVLRFFFC